MNNKFFTYEDIKIDKLIFDFKSNPTLWWSRIYEYCWIMNNVSVDKELTILDAACGTFHPLKFAMASFNKNKVYASDIADITFENIIDQMRIYFGKEVDKYYDKMAILYDKINWSQTDCAAMVCEDKIFDIITCVSVFEHLSKEKQKDTLIEWKRILKDDGHILLTCDHPWIDPYILMQIAHEIGFDIDGKYCYDIPENAIHIGYCGQDCKVFNMILKKKEEVI